MAMTLASTTSKNQYVIWFSLFCLVSVSMTLMNKRISSVLRLPYTLLVWQNGASIFITLGMSRVSSSPLWAIKPFTSAQVKRLIFVSINFTCMLACSLKAMPFVDVATIVVARNVCTCLVAAGVWACGCEWVGTKAATNPRLEREVP